MRGASGVGAGAAVVVHPARAIEVVTTTPIVAIRVKAAVEVRGTLSPDLWQGQGLDRGQTPSIKTGRSNSEVSSPRHTRRTGQYSSILFTLRSQGVTMGKRSPRIVGS